MNFLKHLHHARNQQNYIVPECIENFSNKKTPFISKNSFRKFLKFSASFQPKIIFSASLPIMSVLHLLPFVSHRIKSYKGQSIQEWTKWNLWKAVFKKFEAIWSAQSDHITSNFLKAIFHKFHFAHSWILRSI